MSHYDGPELDGQNLDMTMAAGIDGFGDLPDDLLAECLNFEDIDYETFANLPAFSDEADFPGVSGAQEVSAQGVTEAYQGIGAQMSDFHTLSRAPEVPGYVSGIDPMMEFVVDMDSEEPVVEQSDLRAPLWENDGEYPTVEFDLNSHSENSEQPKNVNVPVGWQTSKVPPQQNTSLVPILNCGNNDLESFGSSMMGQDTMLRPTVRDEDESSRDYSSVGAKPLVKTVNKSIQLTKKNREYRPNTAYQPLPRAPSPWGHFKYTVYGELQPSDLFTIDQINQFIWQHPLHPQSGSKQNSKLIFWIHRNPPRSAHRWPTKDGSRRCRFHDCPAQNNTINQGHWAVTFDELSSDHPDHDPFLNAGYVHLYCMERFCDFPEICRLLNVRAENRLFAKEPKGLHGRNSMRMNNFNGIEQLEDVVDIFVDTCRRKRRPKDYPHVNDRNEVGQLYKGTLSHRMAVFALKRRPGSVTRQEIARQERAGRLGGTLLNHMGDLTVEAPTRHKTRVHKNQDQLKVNPKHHRLYKQHAVGEASESDDDFGVQSDDQGVEQDDAFQPQQIGRVAPTACMVPKALPQSQDQCIAGSMPQSASNSEPQALGDHRRFPAEVTPTAPVSSSDAIAYYTQRIEELQASRTRAQSGSLPVPTAEVRPASKKRGRDQSSDKETPAQPSQRPKLSLHIPGPDAHFGAEIASPIANPNQNASTMPVAPHPRTLKQKHAYQRQRVRALTNAGMDQPTIGTLPPASQLPPQNLLPAQDQPNRVGEVSQQETHQEQNMSWLLNSSLQQFQHPPVPGLPQGPYHQTHSLSDSWLANDTGNFTPYLINT